MASRPFQIRSPFTPMGDQPPAIEQLSTGLSQGRRWQTLLGATGTGKTFTIANVIEKAGRPTLVISHNKTLAAQLYEELRELFPGNSVNYFVSYYDYYQPEAYIPQRDIYIEKDASRNDDLDRLRLAATSALLSRPDTIVVSSVSCLYGLGSPEEYRNRVIHIHVGQKLVRRDFFTALIAMQYQRNEAAPQRGNFRVRGDSIEVFPAYEQTALRIGLFGDEVERIEVIDATSGELLSEEPKALVFPAVHYVAPDEIRARAEEQIRIDLDARVNELRGQGKLLEAQRLLGRVKYDLEMIRETGFCSGIENYSRYFDGRKPGERAWCLLDYFRAAPGRGPQDWLVVIDESHVTLPQIRGMYHGDRKRKEVLVDHGFRLPAALDNRPLKFEEFESLVPQCIFVSATPGPWELEQCGGEVAEQVIRPTGLVDPPILLQPAREQVADLVERARERAALGERTLVTALTKRLCEDLTTHLDKKGLKVRYLHSEIETLQRLELLRDLREGAFDVLVGVNLLREGLDLPEVSLVCILDADKQGFLRSTSSLIQTMGRAARNANATAVLYADKVTPEMQAAIDEVNRRRAKQLAYNAEHGITPETVRKSIRRGIEQELAANKVVREARGRVNEGAFDRDELVAELERQMLEAAERLEFERAAGFRDRLERVRGLPESAGLASLVEEDGDAPVRRKAGMPGTRGRRSKGGR
jgi:excinuclease ABC subunit B